MVRMWGGMAVHPDISNRQMPTAVKRYARWYDDLPHPEKAEKAN